MKILYLNPSGVFGGAEQSLLDVIASVRAARPDWSLSLIAGGDGPLLERARELGIAATVAPMPESLAQIGDAGVDGPAGTQVGRFSLAASMALAAAPTVFYARSLRRKIDAISPTVIHTNGFKMHLLGAWAARGKTPVIWHVHDYVSMRPVMARLMRLEAHRCAAAIANSNSVAEDLRATCPDRSGAGPAVGRAAVPAASSISPPFTTRSTSIGSNQTATSLRSMNSPGCRRPRREPFAWAWSRLSPDGKDTKYFCERSRPCRLAHQSADT